MIEIFQDDETSWNLEILKFFKMTRRLEILKILKSWNSSRSREATVQQKNRSVARKSSNLQVPRYPKEGRAWPDGGGGRAAAAGPGEALPPRTPPAAAAGLWQDEGRKTSFNFQGPNTSFKGEARVVNGTLNRSKKQTLNRSKKQTLNRSKTHQPLVGPWWHGGPMGPQVVVRDVKMSRCQDVKGSAIGLVKMSRCQDVKMPRCRQDVKMSNTLFRVVKMSRCQDAKMSSRCQDVKFERAEGQDVKMSGVRLYLSRCQDVKMPNLKKYLKLSSNLN